MIIRSLLTENNPFNSTIELKEWIEQRNREVTVKVEQIPFSELDKWYSKEDETEKVTSVQEYVKTISGFKSLTYTFSKENKGLGPSIIAGVTEVIRKYGRAIVLEDDLIVQPNFLAFMNQGLEKYQSEEKIFSIC